MQLVFIEPSMPGLGFNEAAPMKARKFISATGSAIGSIMLQ